MGITEICLIEGNIIPVESFENGDNNEK